MSTPVTADSGTRPATPAELSGYATSIVDAHPGLCSLTPLGRSRSGRPLEMLTVRGGPLSVLAVAGVHPNEPVGARSIQLMVHEVLDNPERREGATWHFILCADPDGAALNTWITAGWPPSLHGYYAHMFRGAGHEQPEWGFPEPGSGRAPHLPETTALMDGIDLARPDVLGSLHNADSGGAHYMTTTRDAPFLGPLLRSTAARHGLPLDLHPLDGLGSDSPAPGVFFLERPELAGGAGGFAGVSSLHHAADRYGTLSVAPEAPMLGTTGSTLSSDAGARMLENAHTALSLQWESVRATDEEATPYQAAIDGSLAFLQDAAGLLRAHPREGADLDIPYLLPLRTAGMITQHVDALRTRLASTDGPARQAALARLHRSAQTWLLVACQRAQRELAVRPHPLDALAGFQADTLLELGQRLTT